MIEVPAPTALLARLAQEGEIAMRDVLWVKSLPELVPGTDENWADA